LIACIVFHSEFSRFVLYSYFSAIIFIMFATKDKIGLRAVEPSDASIIYQWENDASIWKVSETLSPYSLFQIEQFILNNNDIYASRQLRLMIELTDKAAPHPIGMIDLFDFEPLHRRAGVGIYIYKKHEGKGYASTALDLLESYAFETLHLHQLYCFIGEHNQRSLLLFQSRGYQRTGTRKDWTLNDNGYTDQYQFQLIRKT